MNLNGKVEIILDAVDIEQAILNSGNSHGTAGKIFIILAAAYAKPHVHSLKLFCERTQHLMMLDFTEELSEGKVRVGFIVRPMTKNEIVAKHVGLSC